MIEPDYFKLARILITTDLIEDFSKLGVREKVKTVLRHLRKSPEALKILLDGTGWVSKEELNNTKVDYLTDHIRTVEELTKTQEQNKKLKEFLYQVIRQEFWFRIHSTADEYIIDKCFPNGTTQRYAWGFQTTREAENHLEITKLQSDIATAQRRIGELEAAFRYYLYATDFLVKGGQHAVWASHEILINDAKQAWAVLTPKASGEEGKV